MAFSHLKWPKKEVITFNFCLDALEGPTMATLHKDSSSPFAFDDEEVFEADALPTFAKSYILPRVMSKSSVEARKSKVSAPNLMELDEVSNSKEEEAKQKAFKLSMLKTSIEHDKKSGDPKILSTLKTLKLARVAVEKWKDKVETSKGDLFDEKFDPAVKSPMKKSPSKSRFLSKNSSPGPRSRLTSESGEQKSGRSSRMMSRNTSHKSLKSLVPCSGPGAIQDYANYVKSG